MMKVTSTLGRVAGVLSLLLLVKHGICVGYNAPLELLLSYYGTSVDFFLGWAEPPLRLFLIYLRSKFGVDMQLYPHWKYMFVPMWLYFAADTRTYWRRARVFSAIVTASWGVIVALAASLASGMVLLDDPNLLPVIFPIVGFTFFEIGQSALDATFHRFKDNTWRQTFSYYFLRFSLTNAIIGLIVILLGFQFGLHKFNVLLLIVYLIGLAARNIMVSVQVATFRRQDGQTWRQCFAGLASQRLGFEILTVVGGATIFVVFGAGRALQWGCAANL